MEKSVATKNILEFAEAFFLAKASDEVNHDWKLILGLYDVSVSKGKMFVPETFYPKIQKWFGTIDDHSAEDAVIRVENQVVGRSLSLVFFIKVMSSIEKLLLSFDV